MHVISRVLIAIGVSMLLLIIGMGKMDPRDVNTAVQGGQLYVKLLECPLDRRRLEYRCD